MKCHQILKFYYYIFLKKSQTVQEDLRMIVDMQIHCYIMIDN